MENLKNFFDSIIFVVVNLVAIVVLMVIMSGSVRAVDHYVRVRENVLTVTATVTHYEKYSDDDSESYRSYVTYSVNGVTYEGIQYENDSSKASLTQIGMKVELLVSPEDPSVLISDLISRGKMLFFLIPFFALSTSFVIFWTVRRMRSKKLAYPTDYAAISRDLKLTIGSRKMLILFLTFFALYLVIFVRFPSFYPLVSIILIVVSAVAFCICLFFAIHDIGIVKRSEYLLRQDVLMYKEIKVSSDPEDSDKYMLYYGTGDQTWSTTTSSKFYYETNVGDTVLSVFLPGRKKPILHYDSSGAVH